MFTNLGASSGVAATNPDINDQGGLTAYTNSSWSPPTTGIIICFVHTRTADVPAIPNVPTISGNSLVWTSVYSRLHSTSTTRRLTLCAAIAPGATTGITTIDFAGQTQDHCLSEFYQITGVDVSAGIYGCFVQIVSAEGASGTSGSVTLATASNANNRPISGIYHAIDETSTAQTNWTVLDNLHDTNNQRSVITQYRNDTFETTASASWATSASSNWIAIAAEVKAAQSSKTKLGKRRQIKLHSEGLI